jgi:hypothetical protein
LVCPGAGPAGEDFGVQVVEEFLGFAGEFVPFALRLLQDPFQGAWVDGVALLGELPALHEGGLVAVDGLEVTVEQVGTGLQGRRWAA